MAKSPINLGNGSTNLKKALKKNQQERILKSLRMMYSFPFSRKWKGVTRYATLPKTNRRVSKLKIASPVTSHVSSGPPCVWWTCSFAFESHRITTQAVASSETGLMLSSHAAPQGVRGTVSLFHFCHDPGNMCTLAWQGCRTQGQTRPSPTQEAANCQTLEKEETVLLRPV